ncbi:DUF3306 domain-containing protein [Yoonia sediminilitoris]|uniref:Uncharacterized protein DUF3306 n=1 Tax=Yoonia sediminilitoris TaxID=1286148 RepID=A0A2T6K9S7_9RHOB|nr:DUF3306 domain-containing protein [Yoonia sediminilitoris]PUB11513.1 uncharacterized protein DUF3306 [Yoonia sediminilitoris]RCW91713.1 uncharacterized protein DUF3306 [Yoonia sediminilitoris]
MSDTASFWARRKKAVLAEEQAAQSAVAAQSAADEQAAFDEMSDAEVLSALELPDPDTLSLGDDFSAFMAKAVPDRIRRRALRTLWRSNPVLANVDMLVDYGEDFTDGANVVENLQTAYQVGKGMMKHVEEMARQATELEAAEAIEAEESAEDLSQPDDLIAAADDAPVALTSDEPDQTIDEVEAQVAPTPRRMTFRIEENA